MNYTWLTYVQARQQLAARLSDTANVKWSDAENGLYIKDALRTWNSLTLTWKSDFVFNPTVSWNFLNALAGSPRLQSVTDTQVYTFMEYQLYEPPTGGTWTGTAQFSISDLSGALQRRRDEINLMCNCNQQLQYVEAQVNATRVAFPENVLEPQRIRFLGLNPSNGDPLPPVTLYRDDRLALGFFDPGSYVQQPGSPSVWMVSTEPCLSFDVDVPPAVEGLYEVLSLIPGPTFIPPVASLLGIPDDYSWVARLGALADLLGRESEATDRDRADWCDKRYQDGLKLLTNTPWIFLARVNQVTTNIPSTSTMDRYAPEWDSKPGFSAVVIAGVDTTWSPLSQGILMTLLANAPLPVLDSDYIQANQAVWDAILSYAQFLATFKLGGAEFAAAADLEAIFLKAAAKENDRLEMLGLFGDVLVQQATEEQRNQERYSQAG